MLYIHNYALSTALESEMWFSTVVDALYIEKYVLSLALGREVWVSTVLVGLYIEKYAQLFSGGKGGAYTV